jgi:hypothetical protein
MLSSSVLSHIVIRTLSTSLGASDDPPPKPFPNRKPFRIRTSEKWPRNSFRIRRSKKHTTSSPLESALAKNGGGWVQPVNKIPLTHATQSGSGSQKRGMLRQVWIGSRNVTHSVIPSDRYFVIGFSPLTDGIRSSSEAKHNRQVNSGRVRGCARLPSESSSPQCNRDHSLCSIA